MGKSISNPQGIRRGDIISPLPGKKYSYDLPIQEIKRLRVLRIKIWGYRNRITLQCEVLEGRSGNNYGVGSRIFVHAKDFEKTSILDNYKIF